MRVVHIAPGIGRGSYGVGSAVLGLLGTQAAAGTEVECWSLDSPEELSRVRIEHGLAQNVLRAFPVVGPARLGYSPAMERWARQHPSDVIHQHMLWMATSRVPQIMRESRRDLVTVIAAHGALDDWALARSPVKKRLASVAYEKRNLLGADCYHAVSAQEVEDFRRLRLEAPIARIDNGISSEWLDSSGDCAHIRRRLGLDDDARLMLYLSRLAPQKNLLFLLDVLDNVAAFEKEKWHLLIVGDWNTDYAKVIADRIQRLSARSRVHVSDPLWGKEKRNALAAADCVVLPSLSEGNPMILLESLACGVPVVVCARDTCPPLQACDCGWELGVDRYEAIEALSAIFNAPRSLFQRKGEIGKAHVRANCNWRVAAARALALYTWLRGMGPRPDGVIVEG